jgi:catechol 2,3-dioxygenase-like lactoylglutathione lyase family enzyme
MQDLKLEVVVVPVSDMDRAKRFYVGLGWRVDADLIRGDGSRVVQLTPPASECSIHLRQSTHEGGAAFGPRTWLIASDLEAARADLLARGADVSGAFHFAPERKGPVPGPDPEGRSYRTWASFSDPTTSSSTGKFVGCLPPWRSGLCRSSTPSSSGPDKPDRRSLRA